MFTSRCCGISRHSDAIKTALRKQGRNLQTHLDNTILSFMACRQRPAHRPTPLLESALSPLFPSLLKKHTHSHALLPSKKEKPLLFTFYIFYKVIPHYHISNVKEESTMQTLLYGAQIIRRTNRMRSTRKAGSCWRTTGSSASALAPRRRFRRAPSSAAFPVGSSCPASSISTPM